MEADATRKSDLDDPAATPALGTWVKLDRWTRCLLGLSALVLISGYAAAARLQPCTDSGQPLLLGVHEQLGLEPCVFLKQTGLPCPTCGMTTSFSHLMHGHWRWAWQAHPFGTILAVAGWLFTAGLLAAAVLGKGPYLNGWVLLGTGLVGFALLIAAWGVRLLLR